jgi:hypothetical protein
LKSVFLFILIGVSVVSAHAQSDSTALGKRVGAKLKENFRISGGIGTNATFYYVDGIPNRRDPFFWLLNANLNMSFWEISMPFSATFSQQDRNVVYPQPFNQFGVSPKYKFVTLHLGYRSMNFSEFSLAGNVFLGAGIDLNPEFTPFKVSMMYGRFAKAFDGQTTSVMRGFPSYERWGYGSKVSWEHKETSLGVVLFKGKDDQYSLSDSTARALGLRPEENLVLGFIASHKFGERIRVNGELCQSSYTTDIRFEEVVLERYSYINNFGFLYTIRPTSQFNTAFAGNVEYFTQLYQLTLGYRRIGPEYRTMGSTFLSNDLEDITTGISWRMFQNKVSISTNGGLQRNNVGKQQLSTMTRLIGSLNFSYAVNEQLSMSGNLANFNSSTQLTAFTEANPNAARPDSLFYLQVTNSGGMNINYGFGQVKKQNLTLGLSYQQAHDSQKNNSKFYNFNLSHQVMFPDQDLAVSTTFNGNQTTANGMGNLSLGPALAINKSFFERRVKVSVIGNLMESYLQNNKDGRFYNAKFTTGYTFAKKHNFSFDATYLYRQAFQAEALSFKEFRGGIGYNFNF